MRVPWTIAAESPVGEEIRSLIAALNEEMFALTPREHCHHMTIAEMAQPDTTVFVARVAGEAVACGALRRHAEGVGEVKRMYTRPERRGAGVGGAILQEIISLARAEGLRRIVLETGDKLHAAHRIYEAAGFKRCTQVLEYPPSPYTIFYAMALEPSAGAQSQRRELHPS